MTKYAFVIDAEGKPLSPTKEVKAWYMIRVGKARLVSKYPMVIQLGRAVPLEDICKDEVRCGIDDGSLHTGIALVQKCKTKNKSLFKGTIEHRKDVSKLISERCAYRKKRRYLKRYRPARFNNRKSSRRLGRLAPSILQKKQAVLRVISKLNQWINIAVYYLEDVSIDIRALTEGYKPYKWQYQKSNRLDENLRKATILRDGCKCKECGKSGGVLEVHHIRPRRLNGENTLDNLITLCSGCHQKTVGREEEYIDKYFNLINSRGLFKGLSSASHVMMGKKWLREHLQELGLLYLTTGGDTANRRIDWDIDKSHANDAICITGLKPDSVEIEDWTIKPMRKKRKTHSKEDVLELRHRDYIEYCTKRGTHDLGYVTALYPLTHQLNFSNLAGSEYKRVAASSCRLLWRFSGIYWLLNLETEVG